MAQGWRRDSGGTAQGGAGLAEGQAEWRRVGAGQGNDSEGWRRDGEGWRRRDGAGIAQGWWSMAKGCVG